MTPCPRCTSDNTRCYGESAHTQYDEHGQYDGDYIVAFYVCDDCEHDWIITNDDVCAANEIIDDDDDAVFAPPADSRESEPYDVDEHLRILQEEYFELTGTRPNIAPWIPPNLAVNILWTKIGDIRRTRTDARD